MKTIEHIFDNISASRVAIAIGAYVVYRILYQIILRPYFLSPLRNLPGPPLGNPLIGQGATFVRNDYADVLRQWFKQYGPVIRVVGPIGIERVFFSSPDTLNRILVSGWAEYPRPGYLRSILGLVAGHGLLTVTGDVHKQMRKTINPAFSIPNLMAQTDMYYDAINGLVDILNTQLHGKQEGENILMYDWMSKVTLDIIAKTAFDYETDSLHNPNNELAVAYEKAIALQSGKNLFRMILLVLMPFGPRFLASEWAYNHRWFFESNWVLFGLLKDLSILVSSMHTIRGVSKRMLDKKLQELSPIAATGDMDLIGKRDIMSILVRSKAEHERQMNTGKAAIGEYGMDEKAMVDQVLTFLGAGHETTASGLSWTLYLLATNQKYQDELRAELSSVFIPGARPDYRTIKELKWLDGVVMESLRLLPSVPITIRRAATTDYIDGIKIPKGTMVPISILAINTREETWGPDAAEFRPERWMNMTAPQHLTFLSFLAGPHGCIGKTMAISEMKAIIGALVANFIFTPAYPGQKPKPAAAITMKPTDGMPLIVRSAHH